MRSGPVLLVEDDPELRLLMETVLTLENVPVVVATNGVEAFNLARAHRPSLILLDLMMPVMSGQEFRKAQLANPEIRDIPVLVISAHHQAPQIARKLRAVGCLPKPLELDAFCAEVRKRCAPGSRTL